MILEFFKQESDLIAQIEQNPKKKQDMDNKIKVLYRRLINKELTPEIINILKTAIRSNIMNIIIAIQTNNLVQASNNISALTSMCWDRNKEWIQALKRIVQFKLQLKK